MTDEFILDLARLLRKHGPGPWRDLLNTIESSDSRKKLVRQLREVERIATTRSSAGVNNSEPTASGRRSTKKRTPLEVQNEILHQVLEEDQERGAILNAFIESLRKREMFSSKRELRELCGNLNVTVSDKADRSAMITPLLKHLEQIPTESLRTLLQEIRERGADDDFMRMARSIMRKDR